MDKLARLNQIFNSVLQNHIATKATYSQFHEKTQQTYETLFDVIHEIGEKRVDLWLDTIKDEDTIVQDTYDLVDEAKSIIYDMVKEKNSIGMDNILRGFADKLEFECGDLRAFIEEEKDEEMDKTEKKAILPPSKK